MIELLKDRYKLGLLLAAIFFAGIIASLYSIYSLPHNLMLSSGYQSTFVSVYVTVGLTFVIGGLGIWVALQYRNEVIVFRDKQLLKDTSDSQTNDSNASTISLDTVKSAIRQGKNDKENLAAGLNAVCKQIEAGQGALYLTDNSGGVRKVELKTGYALSMGESAVISFEYGEGLIGQAAAGGRTLYVDEVPDGYVKIISGLGSASPKYLLIVPLKKQDQVIGVIEIASFTAISEDQKKFVEESAQLIAGSLSGN
jgi:putative methionine-R-sulfoxide reductase with GAF domain